MAGIERRVADLEQAARRAVEAVDMPRITFDPEACGREFERYAGTVDARTFAEFDRSLSRLTEARR